MTKTEEANAATNEKCIPKKMYSEKKICKIAFWNKQKWLNKELIMWSKLLRKNMASCLVGQLWKMINFNCKKISDRMEPSQPTFTISSQLSNYAGPLPQNANANGPVHQRR